NIVDQIDFRTTSKDDVNIPISLLHSIHLLDVIVPEYCFSVGYPKNFISFEYNAHRTYKAIVFFSFSQTTWEQICRRKLPQSLPSVVNNIALEYSS
ncbi:13771_t:CDS:2, partial [Dentiscutata heterogama]